KALIDTTTDDYARVLDTNLKGVYLGSREAFKVMRARAGGTILNMASVAGKDAWAGLGLYSASKFAVVGLSRALADEGAPLGIRVSALCPGAVNTGVLTGVDPQQLIQPEDVADAAMYLVTLPRNVEVREMVLDRREPR
ncbi:MAG TPA: SDR family oxidoreductase, partial [Oscillatoriaceae cyanobacterium]